MPTFRLLFLVTVLIVTSGYRFRCYWACTDQTGIQNDYVEQRDHCRAYAQLKLDMVSRNSARQDDHTRKTQLVNLFSQCMEQKGWDIPSGQEAGEEGSPEPLPEAAAVAAAKPARTQAEKAAQTQEQKWAISRSAECAFARHAATTSRIAAARAEACDLECTQRLKNSPDAPRPSACPAGPDPKFAKGVEREYDPEE